MYFISGEESRVYGVSHDQHCRRVPVPGPAPRPGVQHQGQGGRPGRRGQVQGREHVRICDSILRPYIQNTWKHDCNCVKFNFCEIK